MPVLAIGQKLKLSVLCAANDQLSVNVVWGRVDAIGATGRTDANLAAAMSTVLGPLYKPCLSTEAEFVGVGVQVILPALYSAAYDYSARGAGSITGGLLPMQTSGIITKVGDIGGRGRKGRVYVPFPGEDDNDDDGAPMDAYVTRIFNLGAGLLLTDWTVGPEEDRVVVTPIIYNPAAPAHLQTISSIVARQKWATQKRRGAYGRPNAIP